jgi:hypothetical protein
MATVGSLFINVKARTASFSKKMKGVRASVARLAKGFGRIVGKVGKFAAVLGGIAVAAIVALTVKGLKAVDTMAKLAQTVGSSVKSIQVLRHMATLGGVSIEKMDKSISKMSKNIGESAMGIGTANDALAELGLKATDLEQMAPDVMFGVIADELNKVSSQARKASIAYDIFGRAGQELLVTMKEGSAGIAAMSQKLKDLGVIIGDKQAQMVEKANDAWADIGLVWQGLQNQLAVEFAPMLTEIANRIIQFVKASGGMGQVAEAIVKAFMYAGAAVLDVIRAIQIGWLGLKTAVVQVASDMVLAMGWAVQKMAEGWHWLEGQALSVMGRIAEGGAKLLQGAGIESSYLNILLGVGQAAQKVGASGLEQGVKSQTAELLKLMGESLGVEASKLGEELLNKLGEGWNLGKVTTTFDSLKDKFMGEGFDFQGGTGEIELKSTDLKGAAESLSTAVGAMKVDASGQERLQEKQLRVEEKQLRTSEETLRAIKEGGGALT